MARRRLAEETIQLVPQRASWDVPAYLRWVWAQRRPPGTSPSAYLYVLR